MQPLFIVYQPTRHVGNAYAQYLSRQGRVPQPPTLRELHLLELFVRFYLEQQPRQHICRMWHSAWQAKRHFTSWVYRELGFEEIDQMIIEHLITGKYSPVFLQNTWGCPKSRKFAEKKASFLYFI